MSELPKRRRFQFGLRRLFAAVALAAVLAAIFRIPNASDRWEALGLGGRFLIVGLFFVAMIRLIERYGSKNQSLAKKRPAPQPQDAARPFAR